MMMPSTITTTLSLLVALLTCHYRCSAEIIVGYKPSYQVTDHAAIDLDQQLLQELLTSGNFTKASLLYNKGAHSKSYALVTLAQGTGKINKNTAFRGTTISGSPVTLYAYSDYDAGETTIKLRYETSDTQTVFCQVGANTDPVLDGCLTALGTIRLDGIQSKPLSYSYDPEVDNKNGRTLAGFSTAAEKKMAKCANCPYIDYAKYLDYYGHFDYGHHYISAALDKTPTNFTHNNIDFSTYSLQALQTVIPIATLNLNVWMYVIREFEDALDDCAKGCVADQCNTDKVNAWDEGIAFYAGSKEGKDGSGDGVLSFALADELCVDFNTCVEGRAIVNQEIVRLSKPAVDLLLAEQCAETRVYVETIVGWMTVPLVQALLRSTYQITDSNDKDVPKAEAAAYAAAVLPILHNCSAEDAEFVRQELDYTNKNEPDYTALKTLLEQHYECMGITCEQVGGLWNGNTYRTGAEPCSSPNSGNDNLGLILGLSIAGGVVLAVLVLVGVVYYKKARQLSPYVQRVE